jgi:hypothetical protein
MYVHLVFLVSTNVIIIIIIIISHKCKHLINQPTQYTADREYCKTVSAKQTNPIQTLGFSLFTEYFIAWFIKCLDYEYAQMCNIARSYLPEKATVVLPLGFSYIQCILLVGLLHVWIRKAVIFYKLLAIVYIIFFIFVLVSLSSVQTHATAPYSQSPPFSVKRSIFIPT